MIVGAKGNNMPGLTDSRFNMWRAVIVMAHADSVVKPHEINFIIENTRDLSMTEGQRAALVADIRNPTSMQTVFDKITSPRDKEDFFHFARAICWSDGTMDDAEQSLYDHLKNLNLRDEDQKVMRKALAHFNGVYIEGTEKANDPGFFDMVKGLMKQTAA
jgi:uncharacterized membrane protein YebE (DUF533 family)